GLVDADGAGGAEAMRLQKDHDRADGLLLLPTLANPLDAPPADALDLIQERRAFVDDLERPLAEDLDDLAGKVRADPLDQPGADLFPAPSGGGGGRGAQLLRFDLPAVTAVLAPGAVGLDVLPRHGAGHLADHRHQPAPPLRLDAQHREARFRVVERDALDD